MPGRQARDTIHRVFQIRSWTTRRCSEGLSFLGSAARCILTSHLLVSMTVSCEKSRAKCFSFFLSLGSGAVTSRIAFAHFCPFQSRCPISNKLQVEPSTLINAHKRKQRADRVRCEWNQHKVGPHLRTLNCHQLMV